MSPFRPAEAEPRSLNSEEAPLVTTHQELRTSITEMLRETVNQQSNQSEVLRLEAERLRPECRRRGRDAGRATYIHVPPLDTQTKLICLAAGIGVGIIVLKYGSSVGSGLGRFAGSEIARRGGRYLRGGGGDDE